MSTLRIALFVLVASARNRVRRQLTRLREPRYAIALGVAGLYFGSIFGRRLVSGGASAIGAGATPLAALSLAALALVLVAGAWILGGEDGALAFSEAEVQFFFAAPLSRRGLLHYKLLRVLVSAGPSALIMAVFIGRRLSDHFLFFWLGGWLCIATLGLHLAAASLTRASLVEHGLSGLRRRALTLAITAAAFGALGYGVWRSVGLPPTPLSIDALSTWAAHTLSTPILAWILYPVLAPIRVALAQAPADLFTALPGALIVGALNYFWAMSSGVAFEEASAEAAVRRARRATARTGGISVRRAKAPFALEPNGAPWVALYWKNLAAATRVINLRLMVAVGVFVVMIAIFAARAMPGGAEGRLLAIGVACAAVAAYLALMGPTVFDSDLRLDLGRMDLLRSWPIAGRDAVFGAMLAPITVLSTAGALLIFVAALVSMATPLFGLSGGERLAVAAALSIALSIFATAGLFIQNAGVLLFPAWFSTERQATRGMEAVGQRLLMLAGRLVIMSFGVLPAAFVAAIVAGALWGGIGASAVLPAAIAAALVAGAELYVAIGWLGRAFDRFDVTRSR